MPFHDRADELEALTSRWARGSAEFFVLWGRRRVGKTELLTQVLDGRRGIHFEATEALEHDHLEDFTRLLVQADPGNRLLAEQLLGSWDAALAAIEQFVGDERTLIVLDEFQWIAKAQPEIGSLLNRWWRLRGKNLPIFLVISGSEVSFFERHVLTGAMFGRRTGQQKLRPFRYRDAALFLPDYSPADRIRAFAVCGGMPYYLEQFDPARSLADNILEKILYRDGVLHEEAELLIHEELPDPARYSSILRAIQNGATRFNEIVMRTRLEPDFVNDALRRLRSLDLVERVVPVTAANPERSKQTYYTIADGYLRFHFRFVQPYASHLTTNAGAENHLRQTVLPNLDHFVSAPAFEEICRDFLGREENASTGRWWGHIREGARSVVREVDAAAKNTSNTIVAIGSCKWRNDVMPYSEHELLVRLAPHIPGLGDQPRLYFFAREGFDDRLQALAATSNGRIRLVAPGDLFD